LNMKMIMNLFFSFAKIGVFTFGGGYAMLPMFQRELVEHRGWATEEEMSECYALSQCTPGPIAVNTATYVGYQMAGVAGGIAATLGVVFPSLMIITLIAAFFTRFAELTPVKNAFAGIRVVVCVLILNAVVKLGKKSVTNAASWVIFIAVLALAVLTDLSPIIFVVAAAVAGIVIKNLEVKH